MAAIQLWHFKNWQGWGSSLSVLFLLFYFVPQELWNSQASWIGKVGHFQSLFYFVTKFVPQHRLACLEWGGVWRLAPKRAPVGGTKLAKDFLGGFYVKRARQLSRDYLQRPFPEKCTQFWLICRFWKITNELFSMYIFLILIDCREGKVNFFAMKKSRVVFEILVLSLNLDMHWSRCFEF